MRLLILTIAILFHTNLVYSQSNIVYLDVQFIIDKSNIGIFYKTKINSTKSEQYLKLKSTEDLIKNKEKEIKNQKNILKKDEMNNKLSELNTMIVDYRSRKKKLDTTILEKKKEYSLKVLNILNPLITNYVEKNNISLVIDKKSILVGEKSQDITKKILDILNEEVKKQKLIDEN